MNKVLLSIASATLILVASTSAHSAPLNSADSNAESGSKIQTMPLKHTERVGVFYSEADELDGLRFANDERVFDDSPKLVDGFWKTRS